MPRRYIELAKSLKPKLGAEAATYISEKYAQLRSYDTTKNERERVRIFSQIIIANLSALNFCRRCR